MVQQPPEKYNSAYLEAHRSIWSKLHLLSSLAQPFNKTIMKAVLFIFGALLLLTSTSAKVPLLDEQIGQSIFQQNQPYVIYMAYRLNEQIMAVFEEFCTDDKLCAYLDGTQQMYTLLTSFVGMKSEQYLLILDSSKFEKYSQEIDETVTVFDIMEFESAFKSGKLDRHYTSEDIPTESNDPYLEKIVGLTFQEFIEGEARIKVLYLYSDDEGCSNCQRVYDIMVQAAKNYPDRAEVAFGAMDLFRNDHKLLNQQEVPTVLIYSSEGEQSKLKELQEILRLQEILESMMVRDL